MAFSFGAQPSSQATPLFGAAPTPAFGATSSNPFGAPLNKTASTPLIGASSAASGFGTGFFGGGAPSSSAFSFSSGGAFGATQPAAAPSLFGAAPAFGAASTSASSPGLFGGFGGFGAASQPATNLFGAQSQPQQGGFGFGQNAQPQQGQLVATQQFGAGMPPQPDFSAIKELEAVRESYTPGSSRFRFNHLLLNVVNNPAACAKPPNVDELQWRQAVERAGGINNPDCLYPVPAQGFKDLLARKAAQDAAIREHADRLMAAEAAVRSLARRQEVVVQERIEQIRRDHVELNGTLLRIMRHVDALEGRFAAAQGLWGVNSPEAVMSLSTALDGLERTLAPSAAGGLLRRTEALAAAARLQDGYAHESGPEAERLDAASLASVYNVLQQHVQALDSLHGVLARNTRDTAILTSGGQEPS